MTRDPSHRHDVPVSLTIELPLDTAMKLDELAARENLSTLDLAVLAINRLISDSSRDNQPILRPDAPILARKVTSLDFPTRALTYFAFENITYVGELVQKTETEILRTPNLGRKSLDEIKTVLAQLDLHLGIEIPGWPPANLSELASQQDPRRPTRKPPASILAYAAPIDHLGFSIRPANCLRQNNVLYLGDLVQKTRTELLRMPNFSTISLVEIESTLWQLGLRLETTIPGWPPANLPELAEAATRQIMAGGTPDIETLLTAAEQHLDDSTRVIIPDQTAKRRTQVAIARLHQQGRTFREIGISTDTSTENARILAVKGRQFGYQCWLRSRMIEWLCQIG